LSYVRSWEIDHRRHTVPQRGRTSEVS